MKYSIFLAILLGISSLVIASDTPDQNNITVVCPTSKCSAPSQPIATMEIDTPSSSVVSVDNQEEDVDTLNVNDKMIISVLGQGVAPVNTSSPAQAYALAKRAATADAYRLIAEKVKGVKIEGQDLIKNMMVKRSSVRTSVAAMVRNANLVETTFKEGLCEVEMEITLYHSQFSN
jgi:hypothetical protein